MLSLSLRGHLVLLVFSTDINSEKDFGLWRSSTGVEFSGSKGERLGGGVGEGARGRMRKARRALRERGGETGAGAEGKNQSPLGRACSFPHAETLHATTNTHTL